MARLVAIGERVVGNALSVCIRRAQVVCSMQAMPWQEAQVGGCRVRVGLSVSLVNQVGLLRAGHNPEAEKSINICLTAQGAHKVQQTETR